MGKKVLIIQNKQLGDVLLSTVIADNLKRIDPKTTVHFFTYTASLPLLKNHPNIDKVISIQENKLKNLFQLLKFIFRIRNEKYDLIFDPYNRLQSHLMCMFSNAKKTVSFENGIKKFIYTDTVKQAQDFRLATSVSLEDKLILLEKIYPNQKCFSENYKIYLNKKQKNRGVQLLKELGINKEIDKILMVGIQGSGHWKSYPSEYMAKLVESFRSRYNAKILFNYAPNQSDITQSIYNSLPNQKDVFPQLIGENLEDMLCVFNFCDAVVACEGGLVHMAKALEIPNLNIYSPFISRKSWGTLEKNSKNASVHLIDYRPELLEGKEKREIEYNSLYYYQFLKPELITKEIHNFLDKYL